MPNIFDTMLHEKDYAIGSPSTLPSAPPTEAPPYSPPSPRPTPAPAPPEEEPDWDDVPGHDKPHQRPDVLPGPRNSGRIIKSNRNGFFKLADWHGSTAPGIVSTYDKLFSDENSTLASHPIFGSNTGWGESILHPASHKTIGQALNAEDPSPTDQNGVAGLMYQAMEMEKRSIPLLEKLAVEYVCKYLKCDRFSSKIKWDAKIATGSAVERNPVGNSNPNMKIPESKKEELEFSDDGEIIEAEPKSDVVSAIHKTITLNMLQQGAAMHLYKSSFKWDNESLKQLPAELLRLYRKIAIGNHAVYFTHDWFSTIRGNQAQSPVGASSVQDPRQDGKYILKARAYCYPMLVYECAKVFLQFLSLESLAQSGEEDNEMIEKSTGDWAHEISGWHFGPEVHTKIEEFLNSGTLTKPTSYPIIFEYLSKCKDSNLVHGFLNAVLERNNAEAKKLLIEIRNSL